MGNGSGLDKDAVTTIDIDGTILDFEMVHKAALAAMNNYGKPNTIYVGMPMMAGFGPFDMYPGFAGTPWASSMKLSKREFIVAGLHTTLNKLGALKNINEEAFQEIRYKSIKRLKRAKWARYQQKKANE